MKRRAFTKSLAAFAGLATLPAVALSNTAALSSGTSWADQFKAAVRQHPWLLGYRSVEQNDYAAQTKITGQWPAELRGTLYRNGPAQHEVAGYRYHHWFDGDGMLQAFNINDTGVRHTGKLIETFKVAAERKAERALYPGFASVPPNPAPVSSPDTVNVANISVLHHHDKLLALWEAGSPWEMDPETLQTKGVYAFSEYTQGAPFSAHPRVEPDGTLWNFGYLSAAKLLVLWHIDKQGKVVKVGKIEADPISMVHDFVVTSRHIVIMVAPFHYEAEEPSTFLDAHTWHGDRATRVLVIDKNDFDNHYWLELPAQWVFHYGNGWEDDNGVIRFDAARAPDPMGMIHSFREIMRGNMVPGSTSQHHQYQIDTRSKTISEVPIFGMNIESEFPCVDPRVSCRRNRRLVMLSRNSLTPPGHLSLNEVSTFDLESGVRQFYRYPDTQIPEEHLFVAKPGSAPETQGWVIGTALDWQTQQTLLNVFDVENIADGPIASAHLPYALPLGLHGKFVHG
jgi:all-trans-8'-apo-beta-carotenal 15,15'-oxygenase